MDAETEKIEKIMLERQEHFLRILDPVVQEIIKDSEDLIKFIETYTPPDETDNSGQCVGRPRRNAAKNASNKIQNQAQLKCTKLRRPDEKNVTGNIYDCLTESKSVLQDCTNVEQDDVKITNNFFKITPNGITTILSNDDENIMPAPEIPLKGVKVCNVKIEKLSLINCIEEENENENDTIICSETYMPSNAIDDNHSDIGDPSEVISLDNQEVSRKKNIKKSAAIDDLKGKKRKLRKNIEEEITSSAKDNSENTNIVEILKEEEQLNNQKDSLRSRKDKTGKKAAANKVKEIEQLHPKETLSNEDMSEYNPVDDSVPRYSNEKILNEKKVDNTNGEQTRSTRSRKPKLVKESKVSIINDAEKLESASKEVQYSDHKASGKGISKKSSNLSPEVNGLITETKVTINKDKGNNINCKDKKQLLKNQIEENDNEKDENLVQPQIEDIPHRTFDNVAGNKFHESSNKKGKNDSGLSVYEDALSFQAAFTDKNHIPIVKTFVNEKNNDKDSINDSKVVFDDVEASLKITGQTTPENSSNYQDSSKSQPHKNPSLVDQIINNDATFVMSSEENLKIAIKQEFITPERPVAINVNQTLIIENLLTPANELANKLETSLITDDESTTEIPKITPEKPIEINVAQTSSQVKSRIHALEKVIAAEQQKPVGRITRTKTRMDKDKLQKQLPTEQADSLKSMKVQSSQKPRVPIKLGSAIKTTALSVKKKKLSRYDSTAQVLAKSSKDASIEKPPSSSKEDLLKKQLREEEALRKKEQLLLEKREEQRRKRLEKEKLAQLSREQQEREKLEKLAKEKERKLKLIQERDDKMKQQRAIELEKRKKLEEQFKLKRMQLLEEQKRRELEQKLAEEEKLAQEMAEAEKDGIPPVAMSDGFENLQSDYSTDEEDKPAKNNKQRPDWCKSDVRHCAIIGQARTSTMLVDILFNVQSTTPDLREIFPGISEDKLKRRSSAVWKTPPRYSMLQYHL